MSKIIAVAGGKGGVGKTTLTAALGYAFAEMGKSVCVIDACVGLRNLDLMMNVQDKVVFDFADLAAENCSMEQALVCCDPELALHLIAAPQEYDPQELSKKAIERTIDRLAKRFDVLLLDIDSVFSSFAQSLLRKVDECVLVLVPGDAAQRNTESFSAYLHEHFTVDLHLFMNRWDIPRFHASSVMQPENVAAYIDIPLLGVWGSSEAVESAAIQHKTAAEYPPKLMKMLEAAAVKLLDEGSQLDINLERRKRSWFFRASE